MKLNQLSVFLENKPGTLSLPCRLLADAGINLVTLALADTRQFGILRLVVRDGPRAQRILEAGGCVVKVTEVIAIEVPDRPGALLGILEVSERNALNIEYMYALAPRSPGHAALVVRFENPDAALKALQEAHISVIDPVAGLDRPEA